MNPIRDPAMRPPVSYQQGLEFIFGLSASRIELRLDRVALALSLFGNPQDSCEVFHVAGTNGKGSTAAMLHRILCAEGYRAGLYTSPHLSAFTERIRVADRFVTESEVLDLIQEIWERTNAADVSLTFFEFVTVMALLYFARQKVDTAVVEVGLGGRLDATNVVHPLVSMITSISIDHESFLGSDVASIAREKAGIIKERTPVVCGPLPPEAREVVARVARDKEAPIYSWGEDFRVSSDDEGRLNYQGRCWHVEDVRLSLRGTHQWRNAAVAIAALELARCRFPVGETILRKALREVQWPGRLEVISRRPMIVMDGAHNVEGVRTLVSEIPSIVGHEKVRLLFGCMSDKNWATMLSMLSEISSDIVLTQVPRPQAARPEALREALPARMSARVVADPVEALDTLIGDADNVEVPVLVAGSLYLIGALRGHVV